MQSLHRKICMKWHQSCFFAAPQDTGGKRVDVLTRFSFCLVAKEKRSKFVILHYQSMCLEERAHGYNLASFSTSPIFMINKINIALDYKTPLYLTIKAGISQSISWWRAMSRIRESLTVSSWLETSMCMSWKRCHTKCYIYAIHYGH